MSRASSNALTAEDVGLKTRVGPRTRSAANYGRNNSEFLTDSKYRRTGLSNIDNQDNMFSYEEQLKPRNALAIQPGQMVTQYNVRPQTSSTISRPTENPSVVARDGNLNLNSSEFIQENHHVLNRPSSMSRHSPTGRLNASQGSMNVVR